MKHLKNFTNYIKENNDIDISVDDEIYNSIEMMMRPGDNTLSFDEINDIANENGVDEEYVMWIMQRYLADRNDSYKDELKDSVKDCLDYLKNDEGIDVEEISWLEFKKWFESSWINELVLSHTDEDIKKEFENQTKDPNQLKLPLEEKVLNEDTDLKEFKKLFSRQYGYISHSLTDKQISDFLNQDYVKNNSLEKQADLFQDYLLSQGLADDIEDVDPEPSFHHRDAFRKNDKRWINKQ